jgi:hypothetical protein
VYNPSTLWAWGIFITRITAMGLLLLPSGWFWSPKQPEYEHTMMGSYVTLGVFLLRVAKEIMADARLMVIFFVALVPSSVLPTNTSV